MNLETITEHAASYGGWVPTARLAWFVAAAWVVVVLTYGLLRSSGDAVQDTIRPSGPSS